MDFEMQLEEMKKKSFSLNYLEGDFFSIINAASNHPKSSSSSSNWNVVLKIHQTLSHSLPPPSSPQQPLDKRVHEGEKEGLKEGDKKKEEEKGKQKYRYVCYLVNGKDEMEAARYALAVEKYLQFVRLENLREERKKEGKGEELGEVKEKMEISHVIPLGEGNFPLAQQHVIEGVQAVVWQFTSEQEVTLPISKMEEDLLDDDDDDLFGGDEKERGDSDWNEGGLVEEDGEENK
eukprot:TRINITY_DN5100_c0_g1_i1.p2 TRINITY_DN5100_c0_g1~~TRINITY_DN5100_c0_g1_i1.p2  ORF type:complete len:234 (-),score=107.78 TRINITY_DN5100_c0_g1_i1:90-791(-)